MTSIHEASHGDLILGTSYGMTFAQVWPFLRSLELSGYRGRTVLLCGRGDHEIRAQLRTHGIETYDIWLPAPGSLWLQIHFPYFKPIIRRMAAGRRRTMLLALLTGFFTGRFFLYDRLLRSELADAKRILLTDVRDVFFQADPFRNFQPGLHVFLENIALGECPYNARWMERLFGESVRAALHHRTVCCAGTIIGDRAALLAYVEQLTACLLNTAHFNVARSGQDQALLNYLAYCGRLDRLLIHPNGAWVFTLGYVRPDAIRIDGGIVVDPAGNPIPILHQYDRHESLTRLLYQRIAAVRV